MSQTPPTPSEPPQSGVNLIAKERARQIKEEKWSANHDDVHDNEELARAATCYACPPFDRVCPRDSNVPRPWPWSPHYWRPVPTDRVRELVKAGALIAAEIDRLQRKASK